MKPSFIFIIFLLNAVSVETFAEDEYIVEMYETYCQGCHSIENTDAPVAFDAGAWTDRLSKGIPTLVDSSISGIGNMPPLGSCMECGYDELEALIEYMSQPRPSNTQTD